MRLRHPHILDEHRAARRAALAEGGPIVDHREARRIPFRDGVPRAPLAIDGDDGNEMREQGARRVEFLAAHHDVVAVVHEAGLEIGGALGAPLREGVAEADAAQHLPEQERLLRLVRDGSDRGDDPEMILGDLTDGRVRRRDDGDDPRQSPVGHLRPAMGLGHVDGPEAALREGIDLAQGPYRVAVPLRRAQADLGGEAGGDPDRLRVVADHVGRCRGFGRPGHPGRAAAEGVRGEGDGHGSLRAQAAAAAGAA